MQPVQLIQLDRMPYQEAWDFQREIFQSVVHGETEDTLILCEHPHVYTFGRGAELANFLLTDEKLTALGAERFEIERGGDVTYHGPGQLVGYPILNLAHFKEDLGWYLRALEDVIIEVLKAYNISGFRVAGRTGVWVGGPANEEKICAIGVHASRWCTMHGFAFNVNTDLSYFAHIVPCGIRDRGVTSLAKVLGSHQPMDEIILATERAFETVFNVRLTRELVTEG
ncbi:MAG: lipoyl(octanoyl) transferase LipB [Bacteroidota bacterium]|nr:lipoyl(octanoyl) transferase LipB [Bacteroidota bacterium]MDP4233759.1 lipoyl(octanoyl) transferase LipB [Bacteroidota bacterium]MDP4242398.1 lipoyl(octanoyl) transferase LipB [Bacteroidota bacterium]MDP4287520.1 lipoyl(octanoyl) transferase LipB [Bacteroidota bacterium]